jgi:hypothetical protein
MEMLAELLSLITKNVWAAGMLGTLITAMSGMFFYLLKERGYRRMKRYELTLEHYNDYCCLMFTAMYALCSDKEFEKYTTRNIKPGFPELVLEEVTSDPINDLLCASGRATLVADSLTRELIAVCTSCIINKINFKQQPSDDCHEKILEVLRAINKHLRSFEYWWLIRWGFAFKASIRSLKFKGKINKLIKLFFTNN